MTRARVLVSALIIVVASGLGVLGRPPVAALAMDEADRLWTVGEHAFADGLYPLARRVLERFVERHPGNPHAAEATFLLGKARLSLKAYQPALEAFRQAQAISPPPGEPGELRFWEAETLFRMERYVDARDAYDQVLSEHPGSPLAADALYGRAWANRELNRRDLAVADFQSLLTAYPDHSTAASATFYLARTLLESKRAAEAVPLLRSFAAKYPDHRLLPAARYALAQVLLETNDGKEGLAELKAFLSAYPNHELAPQARRLVAEAVVRKGSKTDLADEYKHLMAESATAESLYDAGVVASRLGRARDAEAAWARVRKEFPDHALASRAALELAQAAFGRSAFKDAAAFAQAAAKSEDGAVRAEGFLLLGESELRLKRSTAAYQAFQSALDGSGLEAGLRFRALAGSGLALEDQQKWAQAARYYDEVAAKSPDKTLRAWAKERRAAIAGKLKAVPDGKTAPKTSAVRKGDGTSR